MSRNGLLACAAALAFLLTVVARWPMAWTTALLPPGLQCAAWSGSIWSGACRGFSAPGFEAAVLSWQAHPTQLFRARLAATLHVARGTDEFNGRVALSPGARIDVADADLRLDLTQRWLAQLPPSLSGQVAARIDSARIEQRRVLALLGRIEARGLAQGRSALGDYEVAFAEPPEGATGVVGQLRDLGGPLAVEGSVSLTPEPGFAVEAGIAARPEASAEVKRQLEFLGTPDAAGRRPFAMTGTY